MQLQRKKKKKKNEGGCMMWNRGSDAHSTPNTEKMQFQAQLGFSFHKIKT